MKVAVCMYGLLRTYKETSSSLLKNVLEVNNADLFIFSPNKSGKLSIPHNIDINLYKSQNKLSICAMDSDGDVVTEEILLNIYGNRLKGMEIYSRDSINFEKSLFDISMNDILIPERVFSLFYNMSGAVKLALDSGKDYDAIILVRPDLAFYNEINIKSLNLDDIHVPLGGGKLNDGKEPAPCYHVGYYKNTKRGEMIRAHSHVFTDQFVVFGKDCFNAAANLYEELMDFLSRGVPFHPETLLFYALPYLQNKKVIYHDDWYYEIVRDNTKLIENDDILIRERRLNSSDINVSSNNTNAHNNRLLELKYRIKRKVKSVLIKILGL